MYEFHPLYNVYIVNNVPSIPNETAIQVDRGVNRADKMSMSPTRPFLSRRVVNESNLEQFHFRLRHRVPLATILCQNVVKVLDFSLGIPTYSNFSNAGYLSSRRKCAENK